MIKKLIEMITYILKDSNNYLLTYDKKLDTVWQSPYDIIQVTNEYGLIDEYDMYCITKSFHKKLPVEFLVD